MSDLQDYLSRQLENPAFAEEWERIKPEYEVMKLLVEARTEQGLTQKELAERTGIRQPNISRLEHGQCSPTLDTLNALARGLGKELKVTFV
jgi:predicted transcriptional regulator